MIAIVAATCNKQVVYTCEDGTKVFEPNDCPEIEVPVERQADVVQEDVEPTTVLEEIISPVEEKVIISIVPEESEAEPMEVEDTTEGFTFTITNVSFTPRTIISISYHSENNLDYEIDPYTTVYSIDLETQQKEFLDNFDIGALKSGQSRDKEESTTIHLKQKKDQLLLFNVYDMSEGKANIANVTYMLDYEAMFGE